MDSRSNKQEELKKRLEEIRQQRVAAEASGDDRALQKTLDDVYKDVTRTTRRNEGQQRRRPNKQTRRNVEPSRDTQQRRNTPQRRNAPAEQRRRDVPTDQLREKVPFDQVTQPALSYENQEKERKLDEYFDRKSAASPVAISAEKISVSKKKQEKKISTKNLLNQLSNGENVAQALILNEVLSKPIALRKR